MKNYVHYWLRSVLEAAPAAGAEVSTYPPAIPVGELPDHLHSAAGAAGTWWRLMLLHFCNIRMNPALGLLLSGKHLFHASQHTARPPRGIRVTATVFDMSCWIAPGSHTPANVAATKAYGERVLKTCDGLIAISEHAAGDAAEILRIPRGRIRAIYPGVAAPFFTVGEAEAARMRRKWRLEAPYVLFVGCIEPRKNVRNLVRGYRQLPENLRRDVELVVAGPFGWASQEEKDLLLGAAGGVRYLGYVPEADLPGLVRGAAALAYPSLYEGFGLPAAQAMAAGVPVIAANRSCLPEVVGDAGLLVDPDSAGDLAEAMERVLSAPTLAAELGARGRARAEAYRWERCAAESLAFFGDVAGQ